MLWIIFLIMGFWQFFSILDGLEAWYGFHWIIAAPLGFLIAQIPVLGSVVGMYSAVDIWNWSWLSAFLLFFGPLLLIVIFALGWMEKK